MAMFSKILIANRGEIAARVIRTARRMGIRTVAVYSEADREALHVEMADEAVCIGPAPASESYLKGAAIVEAARLCGAEAIHPGYGFLSENPDFVEQVTRAGLVFIGPSAEAIRAMGLKDAAKQLMERAKVPVVPGYHGEAQELVVLAGKANEIGFPVLIKARAGGGGKGMRRVDQQSDFADALSAAKREARASFGDDRVLVEKYVAAPRHIEIQVFGDSHGNAVHLFERDCSLQRRHQKVIEEAPAPGMTEEMRAAMGEAAVKAAQAIGYEGAGTVEFIVDASEGLRPDRFWFMEMNTRLQVEHPVTEMITGLDLVEWQLRVAAGEPLPKRQDELAIDGWAFEARIYAEDPQKGFLPATGTIAHLRLPEASARVETGVREGDAITPFYDPMIAKIVTSGADRQAALDSLRQALDSCEIVGTTTNVGFLAALTRNADLVSGAVDTGLIDRNPVGAGAQVEAPPAASALAALILSGMMEPAGDGEGPFAMLGPWSHWGSPERLVSVDNGAWRVGRQGQSTWQVSDPAGEAFEIAVRPGADGRVRVEHAGHGLTMRPILHDGGLSIIVEGRGVFTFTPTGDDHGQQADAGGGDRLVSPMPGIVKQVLVAAGKAVRSGEPMVVMEAMKMELTLHAPRDGIVAEVRAEEGGQVSDGALLVALEKEAAS